MNPKNSVGSLLFGDNRTCNKEKKSTFSKHFCLVCGKRQDDVSYHRMMNSSYSNCN